ncbi:MAG: PorT family protein [Flavobacterium haoranii]
MRKLSLLITLLLALNAVAQGGYRDSNRIGISAGLTSLDLFSKQFNVKPGQGWVAGLSLRGNYYNNWQMVYGMHFTDSNFSLQSVTNEEINYKLSAVQVHLVGSYMVIQNHLTLEIGPVLQINGKLRIDEKDELKTLKDSPYIFAKDITNINQINGNLYAGITAGITNLRLNVNYQYGFNNIMNNLNKKDELTIANGNQRFKANIGMISALLTIYL